MTHLKFYIWLVITAIASLIIGIITTSGPDAAEIYKATYLLIFFFIFFTTVVYFFSNKAIRSADPYLFTRVFMISISLKILFLSLLVLSCVKFLHIKPRDLVGPLLSSYLFFTILETWILMKLSKND